MNETQLLEFYTSGGDLSTLSDADLQGLGKLIGVDKQQAAAPAAPFSAPIQSVPKDAPANIGAIPGEDVISGILKMLSLGAGLAPGGMPLAGRSLIQLLLGGAEGAVKPGEDNSRLMGAAKGGLTQAGMEGIAGIASDALPWAGTHWAIRQGTPYSARPGNRTREYVEAFLRQRQREGFGKGIPVGKRQASVLPKIQEGTIHPTPVRTRLNKELDEVKEALPGRDIDFDSIASRENPLREPEKFLGLSDPVGTMGQVAKNDRSFWQGNKDLIDWMQGNKGPSITRTTRSGTQPVNIPGENILPPPANTLPGGENFSDVSYDITQGDPTLTTFGELVEMAQKQGKEAAPVFQQNVKGQWVRASDSPGQQAAQVRKRQLMEAADESARSLGPGGAEVADRLKEINAALSDQYKIEEIDRMLRRGLAAAGIRGGLGAGAGGSISAATGGDYRSGAAFGGLAGLGLYPTNISRLFNLLGRTAQVAPSAVRTKDLTDDIFGLGDQTIGGRPVRRREPK